MTRPFLTAAWRNLAMLNYDIDPALLQPFVPAGTELDAWQGRTFVSLVGFLFADTRVLGVGIPWHRTFEEVNLRFYVKRNVGGEVRRAVVFIRELVPRRAIALVARLAYNEPYVALPMRHAFRNPDADGIPHGVQYEWRLPSGWGGLAVETTGSGRMTEPGSQEEFITEHYWGYTRQRDGSTVEYQVEHPRWRVWSASSTECTGDFSALYGEALARIVRGPVASAFVADGSRVTVYRPLQIPGSTATMLR